MKQIAINAVKILRISKPFWTQVWFCTEKGFMTYGCEQRHVTRSYSVCTTGSCRKFSLPPLLYSKALLLWKTLQVDCMRRKALKLSSET